MSSLADVLSQLIARDVGRTAVPVLRAYSRQHGAQQPRYHTASATLQLEEGGARDGEQRVHHARKPTRHAREPASTSRA